VTSGYSGPSCVLSRVWQRLESTCTSTSMLQIEKPFRCTCCMQVRMKPKLLMPTPVLSGPSWGFHLCAGEHEASRRMKTEMLVQMEGCNPSGERRVLLVGVSQELAFAGGLCTVRYIDGGGTSLVSPRKQHIQVCCCPWGARSLSCVYGETISKPVKKGFVN